MVLDTFTRFPDLPPEIRLLVWEQTWPSSRIIQPTILAPPEPNTAADHRLKPRCTLKSWRAHYNGPNRHGPCPLEPCPDPIALHINGEARAHTLSSYILMEHSPGDEHSFYFNPGRDILWFTVWTEIGFNQVSGLAASGAYAGRWGSIEMVLGEDPRAEDFYGICVRKGDNVVKLLPGLKEVYLHMSVDTEKRRLGGGGGDGEGELELYGADAEILTRRRTEVKATMGDSYTRPGGRYGRVAANGMYLLMVLRNKKRHKMEWAKDTYNTQYEKWVPWLEDLYLRWFTNDNKASYTTKQNLDKTKVTGVEQVDTLQDGVNNLVSSQIGQGGILQPVGDLASKEGANRAERKGKGEDGSYVPGAPGATIPVDNVTEGGKAVAGAAAEGVKEAGEAAVSGVKGAGNLLGGALGGGGQDQQGKDESA